ncbi:MAG: bifunctional DNA primase/polymerase [Krumholzibacteria bacterium]|nr:bifunctional DNA primase/polymerase [Candidatus Krumholzibacteria bacterium]
MTERNTISKETQEEAHRLLNLGYTPLPAIAEKKRPPFSWKKYQTAPPTHAELDALFDRVPSATALGHIPTGIVIVDRDVLKDGSPNPFPEDPEMRRELLAAPTVITAGGGTQSYFRLPPGITAKNWVGKVAEGVDIRTTGGFAMLPPTVRNGKSYSWQGGLVLNVPPEGLPLLPSFIIERFPKTTSNGKAQPISDSEVIPEGRRDDTLFRLACRWRGQGHSESEILALATLHNAERCVPSLDDSQVLKIAKSAAKYEPNRAPESTVDHPDPGPLPDRLLTIPGFIADVMEVTLSTAPRPNRPLAFAGALTLLATLAGRKVRTESDLRTNIYMVGIGPSGIGKDHPRKINKQIMFELGLEDALIGSIASGQALEDAVVDQPSCLALTDEIDELLMAIRRDKSGTRQNLPKVLMELFTSASVLYQARIKANAERRRINQPNVSLFGTAVPERFYESISARMMDDGFLGRTLIVEAGDYGRRQMGGPIVLSDSVLQAARYWVDAANFPNWSNDYPRPRTVTSDREATAVLEQAADDFDEARSRAHAAGDSASVSIWSRAWEHASKISLLYAISENHESPVITRSAALWAVEFAGHHARRLIATVHGRVAENEFHALLIKAKTKLAAAPSRTMTRSRLLKNMHVSARDLDQVVTVLNDSGDIEVVDGDPTAPNQRGARYRLVAE